MKRLAALGAFKLSYFLKNRVDESLFSRYSRIITSDVTKEELASYPEQPDELFFDAPVTRERYRKIYDACGGDAIALTAVQLYLLALMEERTTQLLKEGLDTENGLTIEAAGRIAHPGRETLEQIAELRSAYDRVNLLLQAEPGYEYLKAPFHLDDRLAAYLAGDDRVHRTLQGTCSVRCPGDLAYPCPTAEEIQRVSDVLIGKDSLSVIHISGERSSGRKFLACHVADRLDRELLIVPFSVIYGNEKLLLQPWRRVLRELLLSDRLLCIADMRFDEKKPEQRRIVLAAMERDLEPFERPVFITTDPDTKLMAFLNCFVMPVDIPTPTISQGAVLWRNFAERYLEEPERLPAQELASKMSLTAGQIERIVRLLAVMAPKGPWESRDIFRLCYQLLDDGRYQNIKFVENAYDWDDLKLAPELKDVLSAICAQAEHQGTVLDDWGLRKKYPYGRSVSVLFSGPPGTGKTMAAQVLAAKLGLELYKIDLSQIVDKYIGETEKRLKEVFDKAGKSNLILFFDEADALLGKRSEVKEAKDKYANTEVAYLLQRMEEYPGITIMATNQAGNMDPAFHRRFRYHVVFSMPDREMRRAIWRDALSGIPAEKLDEEYLEEQFELSGAQIKNVVLNAAYMAADDGGVLKMGHLVRSVAKEQQKSGKVVFADEYGQYAAYI